MIDKRSEYRVVANHDRRGKVFFIIQRRRWWSPFWHTLRNCDVDASWPMTFKTDEEAEARAKTEANIEQKLRLKPVVSNLGKLP